MEEGFSESSEKPFFVGGFCALGGGGGFPPELEQHEEVVVFPSNLPGNIDPAFRRGIFSVIQFPLPGKKERRKLWELNMTRNDEIYETVNLKSAQKNKWLLMCRHSAGHPQSNPVRRKKSDGKRTTESIVEEDLERAINVAITSHGGVRKEET